MSPRESLAVALLAACGFLLLYGRGTFRAAWQAVFNG